VAEELEELRIAPSLFQLTLPDNLIYCTSTFHYGEAMQFLIIGYDGEDEQALERRLAVRDAHISRIEKDAAQGIILYGAAMVNGSGDMCGSMLVCNFASKSDLNEWLEREPYIKGGVWKQVEVKECKVPPIFCE
jgi:uncharacterized protein